MRLSNEEEDLQPAQRLHTLRAADAGSLTCTADGATKFCKCAKCRVARYCSHECQKAEWKAQHKYECIEATAVA